MCLDVISNISFCSFLFSHAVDIHLCFYLFIHLFIYSFIYLFKQSVVGLFSSILSVLCFVFIIIIIIIIKTLINPPLQMSEGGTIVK